jgi:hypothetical protein
MESNKEKRHTRSAKHPANAADIDKTEAGPSRLYAPGKPHEVEAGPARVRRFGFSSLQTGNVREIAAKAPGAGAQTGTQLDASETGPPRVARFRK